MRLQAINEELSQVKSFDALYKETFNRDVSFNGETIIKKSPHSDSIQTRMNIIKDVSNGLETMDNNIKHIISR